MNAKVTQPLTENTPYREFVDRLFAPPELARKNFSVDLAPEAMHVIHVCVLAGQLADALKRNIFYGDERAYEDRVSADAKKLYEENDGAYSPARAELHDLTDAEINILHATLGAFGETAELLDDVLRRLSHDKPFDLENHTEENGDARFYLQAHENALRGLGQPDPVLSNKKKLLVRYSKGAFSETQAQARADKEGA